MQATMDKLEAMLKYVSEHNDFYKKRIAEYGIRNPLDISQWPVLTRKELQENRYNMFSDGYKTKYFNQQLRRQSSSGSTGVPINVYWDYKDWYASNMCLWRKRWQWYGIKPIDKYVMFTLNAFGTTSEEGELFFINQPNNLLSFNVSLIQGESGYEKMAKIINEFKPDWIYIQPFVLNQLIRAYRNMQINPPKSIRYIESIGEILTSDLKRGGEELFQVSITNMYGSEEMNGIAIECPDHYMHVLENNVLIEIKSGVAISECGNGEAILTNLNNFAMPLIRYEQGDNIVVDGKVESKHCNKETVLEIISGRERQEIPIYENYSINSYLLSEVIANINNKFEDNILWYKFTYFTNEKILQCLVNISNNSWKESIEKEIYTLLSAMLANHITIKIIFTKENYISTKKARILEIR